MGAATSAGSLSPDTLYAPVIMTEFGGGVTALTTFFLLVVEGAVTAAATEGVGFGVAFTEASGSFGLKRDGWIREGKEAYHLDNSTNR